MKLRCQSLAAALVLVVSLPAFAQQGRPEADLCITPPGAQPLLPAHLMEGMGDTRMPVTTTSAEAQKFFNQGMAQVHSFWFVESERSFLQAAALDPNMAMAYWGIAVSAAGDYRPAFQLLRDPTEGGRNAAGPAPASAEAVQRTANGAAISGVVRAKEAIDKAMSMRDKVTPRERLYIEAQAARRNPASKNPDADYIAGMRKLLAANPDDFEAKSMLGLALLDGFDSVTKQPRTHTLEGIRMLEEIVAKDDNHFGAHHYIIHAYEGSTTPEKAWHACERYPALVPNIPHALHMPGHIYAQSDKIDEAIEAFSSAAVNELGYINADVLYSNGHHGHNVHFLIHSLNLDGRMRDSMLQAQQLMTFKETPRERSSNNQRVTYRQGYYGLIKTLVRFERWDLILDGQTLPVYDKPEQQAWRHWATGLAYAARGDFDKAKAEHAALKKAVGDATAIKKPLEIAVMELEGDIAARSGDRAKGYKLFRQAADAEAALLYTEPPSYPRPVVEGWANTALAIGDGETALKEYTEALTREPGSGRAYFGQAAALQALHRAQESQTALAHAAQAWNRADAELPQMKMLKTRQTNTAGQ